MAKPKAQDVVRDGGFEAYGTAKPDSKHRIVLKDPVSEHYRIYRNDAGQILLDPQVMIPAREAWLFKNEKALSAVIQGLKESAQRKGRSLGSFAKHARDTPDE